MKGEELQDKDLHAGVGDDANYPTGFDAMAEEEALGMDERQIWLANEQDHLLADVHDAAIFYTDFPPLPDFPCMSSSSSSSSIPAPVKAITSSSSSSASSSSTAASWALLKSDAEEDVEKRLNDYHHGEHDLVDIPPAALSSTASMEIPQPPDQSLEGLDCVDMMETFGYLDLLETNDFFDPSCIFQNENPSEDFQQEQMSQEEHALQDHTQQEHDQLMLQSDNKEETHEEKDPDDMAMVFLKWLRTNKETVSAEDLRSVKIKKSTIECAARRLGGGKEGMKHLLKLVLEWVQTNHLQKRRSKETPTQIPNQYQDPLQNPNPNPNANSNPDSNSMTPQPTPCFNTQSSWIPQPPYVPEPTAVMTAPPGYPSMVGYMGDPYTSGGSNISVHSPYPTPAEYHMLDSSQSWQSSQFPLASHYNSFPDNNLHPASQAFAGYGNQYPYPQYFNGHGERLVRLGSSATKEARKKRMARQRRYLSHRHHPTHQNQQNQNQNQNTDQQLGSDNCTTAAAAAQAHPANWIYWPSATGGGASSSAMIPVEVALGNPADRTAMQPHNLQGRVASDRRQVGSLSLL